MAPETGSGLVIFVIVISGWVKRYQISLLKKEYYWPYFFVRINKMKC